MSAAGDIASEIEHVVRLTVAGDCSVERCSARTRALWERARELGVAAEVDRALQLVSLAEMGRAVRDLGRR